MQKVCILPDPGDIKAGKTQHEKIHLATQSITMLDVKKISESQYFSYIICREGAT